MELRRLGREGHVLRQVRRDVRRRVPVPLLRLARSASAKLEGRSEERPRARMDGGRRAAQDVYRLDGRMVHDVGLRRGPQAGARVCPGGRRKGPREQERRERKAAALSREGRSDRARRGRGARVQDGRRREGLHAGGEDPVAHNIRRRRAPRQGGRRLPHGPRVLLGHTGGHGLPDAQLQGQPPARRLHARVLLAREEGLGRRASPRRVREAA